MAEAATNSSTFHLFQNLPRELRDQIWRDALPEKVGPSLSFYRKGCWHPRRLSESDEDYDHENEENNLNFEFRHDLLDDIQFDISLAYVNREARDIAFAWVRKQGLEMRPRPDRQYPVFVRPFEPTRDALYVALDRWDDFLREPDDRLNQADLFEKLVTVDSDHTRLAVPVALLQTEIPTLSAMFQFFCNLKVLLIVVDPQPDLPSADDGVKVPHRWDFENVQEEGALFWNEVHGGFESGNGKHTLEKTLHWLMEDAGIGLGQVLAFERIHSFEIRPCIAVRR